MGVRIHRFPHKGRGVIAARDFSPGELVESAPVIVIPDRQWPAIEHTVLYDYCYGWGPRQEHVALALGYASLYNHSYRPNARYDRDEAAEVLHITAIRPIQAGDEITVNYNGDPDSRDPVWFEVNEG
ncbi:MAG: hypothetical protein GMKNLPBB_01186 [Myxococcota bacterium]|nr:hypothetical protein [Myxococcota bacterium]